MPKYRVNEAGVEHARELIDAGHVDVDTEWSAAEPSTQRQNEVIEQDGFDEFAQWHLAYEPDASEGTKGRYGFPYGDFDKVFRSALIHSKSRAGEYHHAAVESAADDLLQHLDSRSS